jgi:hypothetical protein
MSETANPKLVLVRKLLASAESEALLGHVEAADGFRNKAMSLMVAHGLSDAMVAAGQHRDDKPIQVRIETPNPYSAEKQTLVHVVAKGLGCKAIVVGKGSFVVGFAEDIERVEMLYTSLLIQSFGEMSKINSEDVLPHFAWRTAAEKRSGRAAYNRTWLLGYASVVGTRIEEAFAERVAEYETQTGKSTDLVLVERKDRVATFYKDAFPKARTQRRKLTGNGYGAGRVAGARADIGQTRVGGNRAAINS